MKIGIAVHSYGDLPYEAYCNHLHSISKFSKQYDLVFISTNGLKVAEARNIIYKDAKLQGCTHLFFLDTDHLIPDHTFECLTELIDRAAMVSGVICRRNPPFSQICYCKKDGRLYEVNLPLDDKYYEVDVCPFGCTLIDMQALKAIEVENVFMFQDIAAKGEDGITYNKRSDVVLCEKLRAKGFNIIVDTRVEVGHIAKDRIIVTPRNNIMVYNAITSLEFVSPMDVVVEEVQQ